MAQLFQDGMCGRAPIIYCVCWSDNWIIGNGKTSGFTSILIILFMPTTQYTKRYGIYKAKIYDEVLPVLKYISMNTEAQLKFPTMKVLKAIAKKLLVNVHEALYLAHAVNYDWPYQNSFFAQNSTEIRDIIFHRRAEDGYSSILMFLLLQTAAIKMTLNDNFRIYTAELESTLPNFRPILAAFMEMYPLKEPSPKDLNLIFNKVNIVIEDVDYQDMVDNVMHLCPTYRMNGQSQQASSCTNIFMSKKKLSQHKTTQREIEQIIKFELMSQNSELDRPIMELEEFESKRHDECYRFESEDCYKSPQL